MLDKKVIHCPNIGPKFSLALHLVEGKIRKDKKYAYIFDFMCIGTEAKLLNALLSFGGGNLVCGFGVANYIDLKQEHRFGVLNKVKCLVDVQAENIGYRIAGSRDEIKDMIFEENEENEQRIFAV